MLHAFDNQCTDNITRPLSIECQDQRQDDAWDEFVVSSPDGHHEQTSLWGQVRNQFGWEIRRILIRENGKIVAGAQIQIRSLRRFGRLAYVVFGPCLNAPDPILENAVIAGLVRHARLLGVRFMVVGLPYGGHYLAPRLMAAGFQLKPSGFPPQFLEATAVINLSSETEQIISAMRRSTRRNIRHSLKKGISVVEQGGEGLKEFHGLMLALCKRRKTTPNPAEINFFIELWQRFRPKGWIRLFFAMNGQEPVSAALAFTFGDWFRVWKVGWSGQHGNLKPNEALWWQMILWARQNGFRFFDFVEINSEEAKRLVNSSGDGNGFETVTTFKLGFGGESKFLPGAYYYVFNPALRRLFRCGLGYWIKSPGFRKLANPFIRKIYRS
ncbi:MAG TPA: GNAT family N-acetyltransferase [Candidatus Aquilonibacter sp.]|nr:GNAT family N-acetyltransferase [Candidatus Aquilonibacter sp.]